MTIGHYGFLRQIITMDKMHSLLKRQLKRIFGDSLPADEEWQAFIEAVNNAYREFDADRRMLERSLDLSSNELLQANSEMTAIIKALRESEEKYRTLVENVSIGVYRNTMGAHGRFLQANRAMVKIFGYDSIDEFMKIHVSDLYQDPGERKLFVEEISRNGSVRDRELLLRKKDGTPIWVSETANVEYGDRGNIKWIDGVLEDITLKRRLEEQLRQSQKMEAIGTLAGGIAHDFNNILTAIIGYAGLLKTGVGQDDLLKDYVDEMMISCERASLLTQSLLAFSRKQVISPKPVDLNKVIKKVEALLIRVIGEDIELRTILARRDLTVMADVGQIEQVLMNLAANARSAMPDGGILSIGTEALELDNEFTKAHGYGIPGPYALISVTDTGHGMDEKTKERIFEPFFTTREVGKGTGLGLAMVYGIIKQHEGYINTYSELGKGTTFKIYLPLIEAEAEVKEPLMSALAGAVQPRGSETILLAEDDSEVRKITRNILEGSGYRVIEAVDGEDAVTKFLLGKDEIQLLIFDVIMPKKSGKDAYEEVKKIAPGVKALFTSGYTADIIHRKGILEEGLNFIAKPVAPDILLKKIREVLDQ
jgi:PAS domain S-box-containing protein